MLQSVSYDSMICTVLQVHVALCLDQYGRWGVDQIARDNFLFLMRSKPFNVSDWRGYVPRRGLLDGGFPVDRAVVYSFGLRLPLVHAPSTKALGVRLRLLSAQALRKKLSSPGKSPKSTEKFERHHGQISITASSVQYGM